MNCWTIQPHRHWKLNMDMTPLPEELWRLERWFIDYVHKDVNSVNHW